MFDRKTLELVPVAAHPLGGFFLFPLYVLLEAEREQRVVYLAHDVGAKDF